ncbi:MAG: LacI family DNA-binding transcriptional regulator [Sedimentisphaerales bacterium]|nr:LacI family DNA-binding transcriptional regulator [Sedimentisphaerales bacterium]
MSISEVAQKAGVSAMTVSRVINGSSGVSTKTRQHVLQVMKEVGYIPSTIARSMRSKDKLRAAGCLCCALNFGADTQYANEFFCDIARSAEQEAAVHGLCLLQSHWQESFEESWPRMQSIFAMDGLCGVLLAGQFQRNEIQSICKQTKYVVVIDGPAPPDLPVASIESDNYGGCLLALEHLIKRGSKRILIMATDNPDHYFSRAIQKAADTVRSQCEYIEVVSSQLTSESGREIVRQAISSGKSFDGIFGNDDLSIGALRALYELKIEVPNKIRVVGFDDISHGLCTIPSLTSIQINKSQLGREAVKTLVDMYRGQTELRNVKKIIEAKLIVRESS